MITNAGVSEKSVVEHAGGVALVTSDASFFVVGSGGRKLAQLNDTAALIWNLIDGERSIQEIADVISELLDESDEGIVVDVRHVMTSLIDVHAVRLDPGDRERGGTAVAETQAGPASENRARSPAGRYVASAIDREVRYRMGRFYERAVRPEDRFPDNGLLPYLTILEFQGGEPVAAIDSDRRPRESGFAATIKPLLPDSALRKMAICAEDGFEGRHDVACFSFCRPRDSGNSILWPLAGYTTIDSVAFGRDIRRHDRPWTEKRQIAVWRGSTTGVDLCGRSPLQIEELMGHPHRRYDHVDRRSFTQANRLQLVGRFARDSRVDVGFSDLVQMDESARKFFTARGYVKSRMSTAELLSYQYLIVVEGNTFAQQLPWSLNSNSVVLMASPAWETIVHGLQPWEHYVPLAVDFSDLEERLEWCRTHDRQCRDVSRAASAFMARYYDETFEGLVRKGVVDRYLRDGARSMTNVAGC